MMMMIFYAIKKASQGFRHIVSYCYSCNGKNRNRMIAATMLYIVRTTGIVSMFICFLEKGHTENFADDLHSIIEGAKNVQVSGPSEWTTIFRQIQTKNFYIKVKRVSHQDFYAVKNYSKAFPNYHRNSDRKVIINLTTVKILKVDVCNPFKLMLKMKYYQ